MSESRWRVLRVPVLVAGGLGAIFVGCVGLCVGFPCFSIGLRYGVWMMDCPAGELRLDVRADLSDFRRGADGSLSVSPDVRWIRDDQGEAYPRHGRLDRGYDVGVVIVDAAGAVVPDLQLSKTVRSDAGWFTMLRLESVPDGDYTLRTTVTAPFEQQTVEIPLPLYVPAVTHVVTDRPIYKPGQEVLFRSVLLDRAQLRPLEGRPGQWSVRDPNGQELLREKVKAGPWGVVASSFPIAEEAAHGTWKVRFESGGSSDEISFEVRPFQLPRLVAELESSQPWYAINEPMRVRGTARTAAGAPLANTPVTLRVRAAGGRWTPPLAWEQPFFTRTDANGTFALDLGRVPSDLVGRNELAVSAELSADDGESVRADTRLVLSQASLMAEAVTELGQGLVGGFNNRVYLRVTTPAGVALPNAEVAVVNPWESGARPRLATTDADGVLSLQIDPGDPVSVVEPAVPGRYRPVEGDIARLEEGVETGSGSGLDLAERRSLDGIQPAVQRCGDLVRGVERVQVGLRVGADGGVRDALAGESPVARCVLDAHRALRFPADEERTYRLVWAVPDSLRPSYDLSVEAAFGTTEPARSALSDAALRARACVPRETGSSGEPVARLAWRVRPGLARVEVTLADSGQAGLSNEQAACVRRALSDVPLPVPAKEAALGTAVARISVPRGREVGGASAQVSTAYELRVRTEIEGERREGRVVIPLGQVPSLRLRPQPTLTHPGEEVVVELIRGPGWTGKLPKKLTLYEGGRELQTAEVDEAKRVVRFTVPDEAVGFLHVEHAGARAVVLSRPKDPLALTLVPGQGVYRPGDQAAITVRTRAGDAPVPAAVSLIGVDSQLAQLGKLTAPDDFGRVTVQATATEPAFGRFDPKMLALGQIRGDNAAQAAMLRISQLPKVFPGDNPVHGSAMTQPRDQEVLLLAFYRGLSALRERLKTWEGQAKDGDQLQPEQVVKWWDEGLREARKGGQPIEDIWGVDVRLNRLPYDLLIQVDPRGLVSDATRLPEDSIAWTDFVAGRAQ